MKRSGAGKFAGNNDRPRRSVTTHKVVTAKTLNDISPMKPYEIAKQSSGISTYGSLGRNHEVDQF